MPCEIVDFEASITEDAMLWCSRNDLVHEMTVATSLGKKHFPDAVQIRVTLEECDGEEFVLVLLRNAYPSLSHAAHYDRFAEEWSGLIPFEDGRLVVFDYA